MLSEQGALSRHAFDSMLAVGHGQRCKRVTHWSAQLPETASTLTWVNAYNDVHRMPPGQVSLLLVLCTFAQLLATPCSVHYKAL